MDFLSAAMERSAWITGLRRRLHAMPEVGNDLPRTRTLVCQTLDELQIPYRTYPDNSSVRAEIHGRGAGRAAALRADMDALRITEATGLPFAAQNGCMHACGHDAHTAMLLGAAALLRQADLPGNAVLLFQCGEEGLGGAQDLVDHGALEGVDVVFGQHAGVLSPELAGGCFGFRAGPFMASRDIFYLTVRGRGCHGAHPNTGVDPIVVSAQLISALQTLISRECGGEETAVLTIGAIHGGTVYNVIPERVEMEGALRCLDEALRDKLCRRLAELCRGLCAAMGAECGVRFGGSYPVLVNHPRETEFAARCAGELFGAGAVQTLEKPLMTSEDMAYLLQARPGSFWCFATPPAGAVYPNHSPRFDIDEAQLPRGAAMLAYTAARWLEEAV
ncbi:MAG: amidohydrolase [Oscillospiraceae bacterium]|nr:amidohydrolase [Oscillospiraceae bacterium]